jgi:hypothetical protein
MVLAETPEARAASPIFMAAFPEAEVTQSGIKIAVKGKVKDQAETGLKITCAGDSPDRGCGLHQDPTGEHCLACCKTLACNKDKRARDDGRNSR